MQKQIVNVIFFSALVAMGMFGFCFALVPIYSKFCKLTGINTSLTVNEYEKSADLSRTITVELTATNNENLAWEFHPMQSSVSVHPGEEKKISFYAKNNSDHAMTVQAIPSFAPQKAIYFFHKIECFCFEQQRLNPNETKIMPVVFRIDKNIPDDMQIISLAYTLFDITPKFQKG